MPEQNSSANPGTAAVLSFVFNGLGQIYNGQILRGLTIVLFSFFGLLVLIIAGIPIVYWLLGNTMPKNILILSGCIFLSGLFFVCALSVFSVFDAYRSALKK